MKVVLVVPSLRKTGVTEVLKNLVYANHNFYSKINFYIVILKDGYKENWSYFEKFSKKLIVLKGNNTISLSKVCQFTKIINSIKPDVIHFNGFNAELYIPFVKKYKICVTAHNMGAGDFIYTYGKFIGRTMAIIQKRIYASYADCIVGVSNTVAKHYSSMGFSNVTAIPNGVSVPKNANPDPSLKTMRKPIGVYVGNIDHRKNTEQILKVFNKIPNVNKGTFLVIGDNPQDKRYYSHLMSKYSGPQLVFTGRVNDVFNYLAGADYFVSASKNEGLPMAAIEAMAENLDLILSDIPQHKELKKDPSERISFFHNASELYDRLMDYYKNNENGKISDNNRSVFLQNFTASQMSKKYVELYRNLIIG